MTVAFGLGMVLSGCGEAQKQIDKAKSQVGEIAVRNAAAIAGTEAFKQNGYPLSARLDCTADVATGNGTTVACTGTTNAGKPATLDGTVDGTNLDKGTFIGKVDGQEVFSKDSLTN